MSELEVGDIVQIDPVVETFGGCLVTVNEVSGNKVMAYAQVPSGGQAYIFLQADKYKLTGGVAPWVAVWSKSRLFLPSTRTRGEG